MLYQVHDQERLKLHDRFRRSVLPKLPQQIQQLVPQTERADPRRCFQDLLGPHEGTRERAQTTLTHPATYYVFKALIHLSI